MGMSMIQDVSDTALWVAAYRADETKRPDALFQDPLAEKLLGEKGRNIQTSMNAISRYASWMVVVRTYLIDELIREYVARGVKTVVNLGAGLDTRPYRMDLPESLRWVEVDYPHVMALKNERLNAEAPRVHLERIGMDLGDDSLRRAFLDGLGMDPRTTLVLTEGVTPYLTEEQAGALAEDLKAQKNIRYWILDRMDSGMEKFVKSRASQKQMKNAPVRFFPKDWPGFFAQRGWKMREERSIEDAGRRAKRNYEASWMVRAVLTVIGKRKVLSAMKNISYVVLENEGRA